jgi:hypothetical protein
MCFVRKGCKSKVFEADFSIFESESDLQFESGVILLASLTCNF